MEEKKLIKITKRLVDITIEKHRHNLLGKENMSTFIKNNLPIKIGINDYNNILHLYNRYLAQAGYEIKKNINKFDIINYNTEEYYVYINKQKRL